MTKPEDCLTCHLINRRMAGTAPLWDDIYRTKNWFVVHSYNTALLGWLVVIPKRHIEAVDELSEEESIELGLLLQRTSKALKETTGCIKTYIMQFAEQAEHPHVHFHVVPRMANQPDERRSTKIFGYLNPPPDERVSDEQMCAVAIQLQMRLER